MFKKQGLDRVRRLSLNLSFLFILQASPTILAECVASTLDDPSRQWNGVDLVAIYDLWLDDLYAPAGATRTLQIGNDTYQVPPWFKDSVSCVEDDLRDWGGVVASDDEYVLNLDELSELAVVVSFGSDETRMQEIDNTVMELATQSDYAGLPCWIARVDRLTPEIDCLTGDTATDASARLGLAYFHAAANPNFSAAARSHFLTRAQSTFAAHLMHEYAALGSHTSGVTEQQVADWLFGGGDSAKNATKMWIGYYQDVAQLVLAAYHDSGDPLDAMLAEAVVDQFLMASEYDPAGLSMGRRDFTWDLSGTPVPANPDPNDPNYWPWFGNNAWDEADAPRALWIGHVLRSRELALGGALAPAYVALEDWVQQVIDTGTHTATASCIQYGHDGTCVAVCGGAPNCNGLGYGLLTHHRPDLLAPKLDAMLGQYDWVAGLWDGSCFGIYEGVRPVKALAAAIGFDTAAFGGTRGDGCRRLDVQRTGSGSGFVVSSLSGIDCGADCTESWPRGTELNLSAQAYAGSTFTSWSGAGCTGGEVTLDTDTDCTASFDGACTDPLNLGSLQVSGSELYAGCGEVVAGSGFEVLATGSATVRAGTRFAIEPDFRIAVDGTLQVAVE